MPNYEMLKNKMQKLKRQKTKCQIMKHQKNIKSQIVDFVLRELLSSFLKLG